MDRSEEEDIPDITQGPDEKQKRMKRILLFTSGLANLGGDPVVRANVFRERARGEIFAVSMNNMNSGVLEEITGDPAKVVAIGNSTSQSESERAVVDLVERLC